jgi:predicted nucleotide-binding protein
VWRTPDDEGRLLSGDEPAGLKPRAGQNVVWEFGDFTALLERGNVAALVVSHVESERATDHDAVPYVVRDIEIRIGG